jgi:hypothetical protein
MQQSRLLPMASGREVVATFRQPFDLLAETTAIAAPWGGEHGQIGKK